MLADTSSNKNSLDLLLKYCKDINEWPDRWSIDHADIQIGNAVNEYFKAFLIDRIEKARAKSTIKIYARYLWALGGELIRCINNENDERKLPARDFILKHVDHSGGPYWCHARDDYEHFRYDSVCKQLFRFLNNSVSD